MDKEIKKRLTRIILVILFLLIASSLRTITKESYQNASIFKENLSTSLQMINLTNEEQKPNIGTYTIKITNPQDEEKNITLKLIEDENNTLPYKYVNYEIIKNDKKILAKSINKNKILLEDTLTNKEESIYKIKFWIKEDAASKIDGTQFMSKIIVM